jgi:hypothetical protein
MAARVRKMWRPNARVLLRAVGSISGNQAAASSARQAKQPNTWSARQQQRNVSLPLDRDPNPERAALASKPAYCSAPAKEWPLPRWDRRASDRRRC